MCKVEHKFLCLLGNVDVVEPVVVKQLVVIHKFEHLVNVVDSLPVILPGGGDGQGIDVLQSRFTGSGHGSGVKDIGTHIKTPVDAGNTQIKGQVQTVNGKPDAVGRGGIHDPRPQTRLQLHLFHLERLVQLYALAFAALLIFGGDDRHFTQLLRPLCQGTQAGSIDAVIVGD